MVEITYLAIAGIAILAMFFGYGFGLFEGRGQGYKKRRAEEEQEKKDQPSPAPTTITVDDPGLLRIKNENGSFALDLDGTRVNALSLSADQRRRLIEMVNILRPAGGRSAPAPSVPIPPSPLQSGPSVVSSPALAPRSPTPQPVPPTPPTIAKEDRPSTPANSIVAQIDAILQARVSGTPLEDRGVFLTQSSEGGVMVYVGLTRYSGIEDVPDAEVKAAIRAAITEWEDKYTPGL